MKLYHHQNYLKNKEKWRATRNQYVKDHAEEAKERSRKHYQKHKEEIRQRFQERYYSPDGEFKKKKSEQTSRRKHNKKIKFINLLGGKCKCCGLEYNGENGSVFDFHHVNPKEKEFNPSRLLSAPDEIILKELSKCVLVCSNCHRLIHNNKY